jgi:two-component system response regulator YesN
MLQELEATVVQAGDGKEALDLYERQPYDVVVTDYYLPELSGDMVAEAIKSFDPFQRVILMTGYVDHLRGMRQGPLFVDGILPKPFSLRQLARAVRGRKRTASLSAAQ